MSNRRTFPPSLVAIRASSAALLLIAGACATASSSTEMAPTTAQPAAANAGVSAGKKGGRTWHVALVPGTYRYTITRTGSVAQLPDSAEWMPVPAVNERVTLELTADGHVDVTQPKVPAEAGCTPAQAIKARGGDLIPRLPSDLIEGASWTDSTVTDACRGSVPATVRSVRRFLVVGDTTLNGVPAVVIERSGTIAATGEGNQGQHRILVTATGVDTTRMMVAVSNSRLLASESHQSTTVDVTTSGRTTRFAQRTQEAVKLEN